MFLCFSSISLFSFFTFFVKHTVCFYLTPVHSNAMFIGSLFPYWAGPSRAKQSWAELSWAALWGGSSGRRRSAAYLQPADAAWPTSSADRCQPTTSSSSSPPLWTLITHCCKQSLLLFITNEHCQSTLATLVQMLMSRWASVRGFSSEFSSESEASPHIVLWFVDTTILGICGFLLWSDLICVRGFKAAQLGQNAVLSWSCWVSKNTQFLIITYWLITLECDVRKSNVWVNKVRHSLTSHLWL